MLVRIVFTLLLCLPNAATAREAACTEPQALPWACECNHCSTQYRNKKGHLKTVHAEGMCQCPPKVDGAPEYIQTLAREVKIRRPFCGSIEPWEKALTKKWHTDEWHPMEDICPEESADRSVATSGSETESCRPGDSKEQSIRMGCWIWRNLPGVTYRHYTNAGGSHSWILVKVFEPSGCRERYWIVDASFERGFVSEVGLFDSEMYALGVDGTQKQLTGVHSGPIQPLGRWVSVPTDRRQCCQAQ